MSKNPESYDFKISKIKLKDYMEKNHSSKNYRYILSQIKTIFTSIKKAIISNCFPENKYCFLLLQASFYIRTDFRILLWNLDERVDYFNEKKTYLDILEGVMSKIINIYHNEI